MVKRIYWQNIIILLSVTINMNFEIVALHNINQAGYLKYFRLMSALLVLILRIMPLKLQN